MIFLVQQQLQHNLPHQKNIDNMEFMEPTLPLSPTKALTVSWSK